MAIVFRTHPMSGRWSPRPLLASDHSIHPLGVYSDRSKIIRIMSMSDVDEYGF